MIFFLEGYTNKTPVEEILIHLFPSEKHIQGIEAPTEGDYVISFLNIDENITATSIVSYNGNMKTIVLSEPVSTNTIDNNRTTTRLVRLGVYQCFIELGATPSVWGALTGVKPVKMFTNDVSRGISPEEMRDRLTDKYFVTPQRAKLVYDCGKISLSTSKMLKTNQISLYISIPFCPSRCSYCSFVSSNTENSGHLIPQYVDTLIEELKFLATIYKDKKIISIYIGGGTPTTLNPLELASIMQTINESFDLSMLREYTVEAGRADTIDKYKLETIRDFGASRISINPQSFSDEVLKTIGRKHSANDTINAYHLARSLGFENINMDVIAGLDGDTLESFKATMDKLIELEPENITIHTLAGKKGADTKDKYALSEKSQLVSEMLDYSREVLFNNNYIPYYLYKQKYMAGSFENIGYSKNGFECLYNILMMEELQTIIAAGAGAITKIYDDGHITRINNPKYPYDYNIEDIKKKYGR